MQSPQSVSCWLGWFITRQCCIGGRRCICTLGPLHSPLHARIHPHTHIQHESTIYAMYARSLPICVIAITRVHLHVYYIIHTPARTMPLL